MRIAVCHNFGQQPGGEDAVFQAEVELLRAHGDEVFPLTMHNDAVASMSRFELARKTVWNRSSAQTIASVVERERIDVVHFHNTLPLVSPAAYSGARKAGAAVVQTLHNYRFVCPGATLFREGDVCEDCLGKKAPWPGVARGCYRGSSLASAGVAGMLTFHRYRGTYERDVDAYIALSEFAREKLIAGGMPADKLIVKPNFIYPDPGLGSGRGRFVLFLGRLSAEKGVEKLLEAWSDVRDVPLKIAGSGPLEPEVMGAAEENSAIRPMGRVSDAQVNDLLKRTRFLIIPSVNYQGFPRTVVEAYARGVAVLAPRLGSLGELVVDGETGVHYEPGSAEDLRCKAVALYGDAEGLKRMRANARQTYLDRYQGKTNYELLRAIYDRALVERHGHQPATSIVSEPAVLGDRAVVNSQG